MCLIHRSDKDQVIAFLDIGLFANLTVPDENYGP